MCEGVKGTYVDMWFGVVGLIIREIGWGLLDF